MRAWLVTYLAEHEWFRELIQVDDRYDWAKGPHHEDNEDYKHCIVGSNQDILPYEED